MMKQIISEGTRTGETLAFLYLDGSGQTELRFERADGDTAGITEEWDAKAADVRKGMQESMLAGKGRGMPGRWKIGQIEGDRAPNKADVLVVGDVSKNTEMFLEKM